MYKNRFWMVLLVVAGLLAIQAAAGEPKVELLWPHGAPGAKGTAPDDQPTLGIYLADSAKATGAAVAICPGGGYAKLAMDHEGVQIAQWFNSLGVSAFVVDYRHHGKGYEHPAPLDDAQRAIRIIRARAAKWKIDPAKIGIMGFSAGGHLASTAATHFDAGNPRATDPVARVSCRPDFAILCYAVIAFDEPYTHRGSQRNLLGDKASLALVRSLSNEKQVTAKTPPCFIWATDEDKVVPAENSVQFYLALRRAGVPGELHIFQKGKHGQGLASAINGTNLWPECCKEWMRNRGLVGK